MTRGLRALLRCWVRRTPLIYVPGRLLQDPGGLGQLCWPGSDLIVEGYPSSANSFTYNLFQLTYPSFRIAHHTHSVANLKLARYFKVPGVVLIRRPEECIPSRVVRFGVGLELAVIEYLEFYKYVRTCNNSFVVLPFDKAIDDPGAAVRRCQVILNLPRNSVEDEKLEAQVRDRILDWQNRCGDEDAYPFPSRSRERAKANIREELERSGWLGSLQELFREVVRQSALVNGAI